MQLESRDEHEDERKHDLPLLHTVSESARLGSVLERRRNGSDVVFSGTLSRAMHAGS